MALQSMTGFGEASTMFEGTEVRVEVRSVNHRFLDISCRLPQVYSSFEHDIVKLGREHFHRGKVDVAVYRTVNAEQESDVVLHEELFESYLKEVKRALKLASVKDSQVLPNATLQILQKREVLEVVPREVNMEKEEAELKSVVSEAFTGLLQMRTEEGRALLSDIGKHVKDFEKCISDIKARIPETVTAYQERLETRLSKLLTEPQVDPQRMAQEVAILADRSDVSEELARLESHLEQFQTAGEGAGAVGRKLEFLLQEMGREVNTIGSKAQHAEITNTVIEGKSILEKIREQVLNIE